MSDHKSVARNQGYTRGAVEHIERHNERKNTNYSNVDVILEQSHNNVHFKVCDGTYLGVFDRMIKSGEISTRGLKLNNEGTKPESSVIAEMVLDVNTEYFETQYESHGYANGYDFAKAFYAEAYKMAVADVGDEKYVLSATLHADERNKSLSAQLGRDVYHYHLHVVYIPIVRKEIYYNRSNKNPELAGKLKEVINQVNHSKKWESEKIIGEDGKEYLEYSYSKLQDRYHDHMKAAGFDGFERGKVGSTAEHLSAIEYKTLLRQEELAEKEKALAAAEETLTQKSEMLAAADEALTAADKHLAQKKNRVEKLTDREKDIQERIKSIEDSGQILTLKQIEKIQTRIHAPLVGKPGIILAEEDEKSLRRMAVSAAKAIEEANMFKNIVRVAYETIRDIVQAVGLLKFNFKGDLQPTKNLTPEQEILIAAILNHGMDISKKYGYEKLADEMKKAKMGKPISEKFNKLEEEYRIKNKPSFDEILQSAALKSKEQDERNRNAPKINQGRKSYGEEL
jgi:hypothetical protein